MSFSFFIYLRGSFQVIAEHNAAVNESGVPYKHNSRPPPVPLARLPGCSAVRLPNLPGQVTDLSKLQAAGNLTEAQVGNQFKIILTAAGDIYLTALVDTVIAEDPAQSSSLLILSLFLNVLTVHVHELVIMATQLHS